MITNPPPTRSILFFFFCDPYNTWQCRENLKLSKSITCGQTKIAVQKTHTLQCFFGLSRRCVLFGYFLKTNQPLDSLTKHCPDSCKHQQLSPTIKVWQLGIHCPTIGQLDIHCPTIGQLDLHCLTIWQVDIHAPTIGQFSWTYTVQP